MARARFTVSRLKENLAEINDGLAEKGSNLRFRLMPRNGYQAVDEYEVDDEGNPIGTGCARNVGCGTSREVDGYCWDRYYAICNRIDREASEARIKELEAENERLKAEAEK